MRRKAISTGNARENIVEEKYFIVVSHSFIVVIGMFYWNRFVSSSEVGFLVNEQYSELSPPQMRGKTIATRVTREPAIAAGKHY
jgi:hypothetical protein